MANTLKLGAGKWATGKDTVLSFNDENGNFKPLPFDFSRASSATVVNQSGLIETVGSGEPRIDFQDNTKGALKLEPQRSNLFTYSEDFSQSYWNKNSASVTLTSKIAPNGTLNSVYNLVGTAANLWSAGTIGTQHTISFYIKSNGQGKDKFRLRLGNNTSIEYTATNEWVRYEYSETPTTSVYSITTSSAPNDEYDLLVWGGQSEVGSYATSYIPTSGSAVTRLRDLSDTQNLSHVIGQTEGVIFYDAILVHKSTSTAEDLFELSIDDGSANNAFFINNYNNTLSVILKSGGSTSFSNNSFNPTEGARYKLGFAYKQNDFALYINGNQIATDSSGTVPTMNQITFGNYYNNQLNLADSVKINDFKLYNTRLSNSELAALTS